ncbi:TonB family protein [Mucilaginibacter aquatilis]|uniref:TonB family protein n=1 Tax=Mucilaginibacter aquatilis TaxID=1517760 RepID=A0A6I4IPD0_9SPHI|nr:TonB family protein [Mucilaginibacter aquatilis]MVN89773.1 TonB family protein [Mucilaginibacter aquatilis]
MINFLQYLLEVNVYLALAYLGYWALLRRQTFYNANRAYLLTAIVVCFMIPLVQISFEARHTSVVTQALIQQGSMQATHSDTSVVTGDATLEPFKALTALYLAAVTVLLVLLLSRLYKLLKLISGGKRSKCDGYILVQVPETPSPFSFISYVFVANEDQMQPVILKHELVHINQKHSYDILLLEVVKVICWFNPVVYLLQNSLKTIHEFEADRLTAGKTEQDSYVDFLIAQACQNSGLSVANHFSEKNLLKSRIMKLYQKRSGKLARLNYLMALPLCAGMLCASSAAFSKEYGFKVEWGKAAFTTTGLNAKAVSSNADSLKKLRLKVTSGNTTAVTDQLKVNGASGKQLVYTAQNITENDKRNLKEKFGIKVETISAESNTTSIMALPPPPPATARNLSKYKLPPPPPPPIERPGSKKNKKNIPPPPPPIEGNLKDEDLTASERTQLKNEGKLVTYSFQELLKHVNRNMRYPAQAQKNNVTGTLLTSFRVDENREVSDVAIKQSANPILDSEAKNAVSSYKGKVIAKPGNYTMRLSFKLQYPDGKTSESYENKSELERPTAGTIIITAEGDSN